MTARRSEIALPVGMTPRLLSREQAAAYVGLSPGAFDSEVDAGTYPRPFPLRRTKRLLWDRIELDRALDSRLTTLVEGDWDERKERWKARQGRKAAIG